jgi:hypothetical protein
LANAELIFPSILARILSCCQKYFIPCHDSVIPRKTKKSGGDDPNLCDISDATLFLMTITLVDYRNILKCGLTTMRPGYLQLNKVSGSPVTADQVLNTLDRCCLKHIRMCRAICSKPWTMRVSICPITYPLIQKPNVTGVERNIIRGKSAVPFPPIDMELYSDQCQRSRLQARETIFW